jgi:hypothetical protein
MKKLYITSVISLLLAPSIVMAAGNEYNPQISLVLDGRYSGYSQNNAVTNYKLPGFQLGEGAGLDPAGFAIGESEMSLYSNIDQDFFGVATVSFANDGSSSIEQAFAETQAIGNGVSLKFGRFLSSFGYLNSHHAHTWDFTDAPLMYRALFGDTLKDDGVQVSYIFPTDLLMQLTAEALSGNAYPGGGNTNGGIGASTLKFTVGGDAGISNSWEVGVTHWEDGSINNRTDVNANTFSGSSKINALHMVYKWAPNGNKLERNFHFQSEIFKRTEDGNVTDIASSNSSTYNGDQAGWYAQAVYQFMFGWSTGVRLDHLSASNSGNDNTVLNDIGLISGHDPKRSSAMLQWKPSEFSRIRLQLSHDQSTSVSDNQMFVQYTFALGSHPAHQF